MKSASLILGIVIALAAAVPAHARKGGDDFFRGERFEDRGFDLRSGFRRDGRGDGAIVEEDRRGRGRLTPEERRDLRRDIRDAGRDIYLDRRGRGRD